MNNLFNNNGETKRRRRDIKIQKAMQIPVDT